MIIALIKVMICGGVPCIKVYSIMGDLVTITNKKKIKSIISVLEYYDDRQEAYNTLEYLLDNGLITEYKSYLFQYSY